MRGIFMSVITIDGDHCVALSQTLGPVAGRFYAKSPGRHQFGQSGALVLLVFDDQYFFVAHRLAWFPLCVIQF